MILTSGATCVYRSISPPTADDRHGASPPAVSMATVRTVMVRSCGAEGGGCFEVVGPRCPTTHHRGRAGVTGVTRPRCGRRASSAGRALLRDELGGLHHVQRGPLAQVVAADEQVERVRLTG